MRALCSRVIVVYKGEIVEEGQTEDVLLHPKHEYTRHLVASIPEGEKGESSGGEILRLTDLNVFYDVRGGLFRKKGKKTRNSRSEPVGKRGRDCGDRGRERLRQIDAQQDDPGTSRQLYG